jgi:hypothetical protein
MTHVRGYRPRGSQGIGPGRVRECHGRRSDHCRLHFFEQGPPGEVKMFTRRCSSSSMFLGTLCTRAARVRRPTLLFGASLGGQWSVVLLFSLLSAGLGAFDCGLPLRRHRGARSMKAAVHVVRGRSVHHTQLPAPCGHACARGGRCHGWRVDVHRNVTSHVEISCAHVAYSRATYLPCAMPPDKQ